MKNDIEGRLEAVENLARMAKSEAGASSSGGSLVPLVRTKFIDGLTTVPGPHTGAISNPFATISAWLASLTPPTTLVDANTSQSGLVSPATYTESLAIPAYRYINLQSLTFLQTLTGNVTWANVNPGGGAVAPNTAVLSINGMFINGNLTVTDDGSDPEELGLRSSTLSGNLVATGATDLTLIQVSDSGIGGQITSTASGAGALIDAVDSQIGSFIGRGGRFRGCILNGALYTIDAASSVEFLDCQFTGTPVISGGVQANFDGPSYSSFVSAGGTVTAPMVPLVVGGYNASIVDLNDTLFLVSGTVAIAINGVGATAPYTQGGNHYTYTAGSLAGGAGILNVLAAGAKSNDTMRITRNDVSANTVTINDAASATLLVVLPVTKQAFADLEFNGTNWALIAMGTI
jgi:hypothetical protein